QWVDAVDLQPVIRDAGGDENGPGLDGGIVLEGDDPSVPAWGETLDLSHDQKLGPKRDRLLLRPPRQIGSGNPARAPEMVRDQRAGPGLPAWRLRFGDGRAQSVPGSVDGSGEAGRSRTDDDEIVEPTLGLDVPAEHLGNLGVRGIAEHPVAKDHGGQGAR